MNESWRNTTAWKLYERHGIVLPMPRLTGDKKQSDNKTLVKKGAPMDVDIPKLVRTIARKTGLSRSQVEAAFKQVVAEHTGAATKAEEHVPGLNLSPIGESQHAAVKAAKNMTGATTRRQRLASERDAFGRNMGGDKNHEPIERGIHGERMDR